MKQTIRSSIATMKLCVREQSYFGLASLLGKYILQAAGLGAMLMIWRSLFAQGAAQDGMTLRQFYVYTILSTALAPLLDVRTPASRWLHDGAILSLYQRPCGVFVQLAAHTIGGWMMRLVCLSVPVVLIALFCGLDMRPQSPWFLVSLVLTVSEGFAVDYLFACVLIRLRNLEWCVIYLRDALNALFTGSLIPFAALPWGMGQWLQLSPLGTLAGAPLAIYTGLGEAGTLIAAQLFWNLILWPMAVCGFAASRERLVSYGG